MSDPDSGAGSAYWDVLRLGSAPGGRCRSRLCSDPTRGYGLLPRGAVLTGGCSRADVLVLRKRVSDLREALRVHQSRTTGEAAEVAWFGSDEIEQRTDEAYAVRMLDALFPSLLGCEPMTAFLSVGPDYRQRPRRCSEAAVQVDDGEDVRERRPGSQRPPTDGSRGNWGLTWIDPRPLARVCKPRRAPAPPHPFPQLSIVRYDGSGPRVCRRGFERMRFSPLPELPTPYPMSIGRVAREAGGAVLRRASVRLCRGRLLSPGARSMVGRYLSRSEWFSARCDGVALFLEVSGSG
jgi:hypothetical protein